MPRLGGPELIRAIRQDARLRNCRIIVITGSFIEDTARINTELLDSLADDVLLKPFDSAQLFDVLLKNR